MGLTLNLPDSENILSMLSGENAENAYNDPSVSENRLFPDYINTDIDVSLYGIHRTSAELKNWIEFFRKSLNTTINFLRRNFL